MSRFLAILALCGAILVGAMPTHAASSVPIGRHILGLVLPNHGQVGMSGTPSGLGNLTYNGGPVQTGTHHTYAIYWGGSGSFSTNYQTLINGFFTNVAAASGQTSNVYNSDKQYYQTNSSGAKTYITYSEQFAGSWQDPTLPSASDCSSTAGGSLCVSDAAVESEVTKAINANKWPTGLGAEYFVFLGNGVSTCYDASNCAFSQFCAYHSNYSLNGSTVLYANMPYTGHNLSSCGGGNYPNNNPAADATINVTSHEANETITDPLGSAWYDMIGYENGDKCAWNFGPSLGGGSGAQYNQSINGAHYELQQEYSNYSRGCVLTGK